MHRGLKSRLIPACIFRIYTQNLHINNTSVDIRMFSSKDAVLADSSKS